MKQTVYLFVNGTEIYKFKAKVSLCELRLENIIQLHSAKATLLCL